jgi:hypothetical protein
MLKELIQEKHSCKKSKSNERGVCPVFREIAHITLRVSNSNIFYFSLSGMIYTPSLNKRMSFL